MPTLTLKAYEIIGSALAVFLLAFGLFGYGDYHGRHLIQARWDAEKVLTAKALAEAQERAATISERVVTKYVDRIQTVQGATQTIIQKVPVYVTAKADAACPIPAGFVRVLDSAARGSALPATPSVADDAPSGVALSTVAASVADNYGNVCRANAEQLSALQDWVTEQAKRSPAK
jgi:hypothetical protein